MSAPLNVAALLHVHASISAIKRAQEDQLGGILRAAFPVSERETGHRLNRSGFVVRDAASLYYL